MSFSYGRKIDHKNLMDFMKNLGPVIIFSTKMQFNHAVRVLSRMSLHYMMVKIFLIMICLIDCISPNSYTNQVPVILLRKVERKTIKKLK